MPAFNKTTRRIFLFLFPFALFLFTYCQKNTTPVELTRPQVTLSAEAGVIEAWLTVTTEEAQGDTLSLSKGAEVVLTRDGTERLRFALPPAANGAVAETTVVDTGLLPAHSYTYAARLVKNGETAARSNSVPLTTMDTTSHDFSIDIFSFGEKGNSAFWGVEIINDNNIWVSGTIFLKDTYTYDSLGNWIEPYNAAHWDGQQWELKRIPFIGQCSAVDYPPLRAIWAPSENEIYFSNGGSIVRYDGAVFQMDCGMNTLLDGEILKVWGIDSANLYAIGVMGTIVRYNEQHWEKIESHTSSTITDIWGGYDHHINEYIILCTASLSAGERKLLRIHPDGSVTEIDWSSQNQRLHSVWFQDMSNVFLCGGGVYVRNRLGEYKKFTELPAISTNSIRGQGINDIFVVGDFGILAHYSGKSWKQYTYFDEVDKFYSIDYKDDLAVIVGFKNSQAVIYMLRRM